MQPGIQTLQRIIWTRHNAFTLRQVHIDNLQKCKILNMITTVAPLLDCHDRQKASSYLSALQQCNTMSFHLLDQPPE